MESLRKGWIRMCQLGRRFGPYLVIEAVMPGGTLIALLLYCYRQARS